MSNDCAAVVRLPHWRGCADGFLGFTRWNSERGKEEAELLNIAEKITLSIPMCLPRDVHFCFKLYSNYFSL